jgi:hypothetical protein
VNKPKEKEMSNPKNREFKIKRMHFWIIMKGFMTFTTSTGQLTTPAI